MTPAPRLMIHLASTLTEMMVSADGRVANECVSAPRHFPGFDGRVTIQDDGAAQYYYLEARIAPKQNLSESAARVTKVVTTLLVHYLCTLRLSPSDQLASFRSIFVIFYEWGSLQCMNDVSRSEVRAEISATLGIVESLVINPRQPIVTSVTITGARASANSSTRTIDASLGGMIRSAVRRLSRTEVESSVSPLTLDEIRNALLEKCDQSVSCSGVLEAIKNEVSQQSLLRQHMVQCFDAYLAADDEQSESVRAYVVNRATLEEWLVPPVSPIPYVMEAMELVDKP